MISLNVNGSTHSVDVDPDMPLLWVLRDVLGLTGTKYSCGMGECGACLVQIDGVAVNSCTLAVAFVQNKKITTIEGLSESGRHLVQQVWRTEQVAQCGYCQSGQVMAAEALLSNISDPTDMDIDKAMSKVLCRCGTYPRIRKAIHKTAKLIREGEVSS